MNIFIDTNVFLSFFHLSNDDLEELKKLAVLLRERRAKLWLPDQVVTEFRRNREVKIADAVKHLREQKLNLQFPVLCKDYGEYDELRQLQRQYEQKHSRIIERIMGDVATEQLKADITIKQLFDTATKIDIDEELIDRAWLRYNIGNPPGKNNSLGDAINWEALLASVPDGEILYFLTDDKDYYSQLDKQLFNPFLLYEWREKKKADLVSYRLLSSFFREHFPDIKLATELEKDISIRDLASSGSFAQTHSVVARLNRFTDYSAAQINDIVSAVVNNRQVSWILEDKDVGSFVEGVILGKEDRIDANNLQRLRELIEEAKARVTDE